MTKKAILILLFISINSISAFACVPDKSNVSAKAETQKAVLFENISHYMLMPFIFEKLGPAVRDTGDKERHVFEWNVPYGETIAHDKR